MLATAASACLLGALAAAPAALATEPTGGITGMTTEPGGSPAGTPVSVQVCAYAAATDADMGCANSNASGEYSLEGLAPGAYDLEFSDPAFVTEYYSGRAELNAATPVSVFAGEVQGGIDALMAPLATATAKPERVTSPEIWGAAEVGGKLGCDTGIWLQEPTAFAYEWLRDEVAIPSATGPEYEVAPADRGHPIGCTVTATNSFGSTEPPSRSGRVVEVPNLQHTLAVAVSGNGVGLVRSQPGSIFCGASCSDAFDEGTEVVLTAEADPGSTFSGWSGACSGTGSCQILLSADVGVGATFTSPPSTSVPPAGSPNPAPTPKPKPKPKPLKCRKGFKKKKVKGKPKCVKVQKKHRHKQKR